MADRRDDTANDAALRARLDELSRTLDHDDPVTQAKEPVYDKSLGAAVSLGARVLTEFVAGIGIGALIGWQLDKWFATSPVFLILFLTLGTAAGFWNVYRIAAKPTRLG